MKCRPFPFDKKIKNCYEIYACRRAAVPASVLAGAAGRTACMFFTVMVMIVVGTYSVRIVIQSSIEIGFYIWHPHRLGIRRSDGFLRWPAHSERRRRCLRR